VDSDGGGRGSRYGTVAEGSAVGIFFPVAIVAGYLMGKWLGRALGLGEAAALAGAGLGVAAAFLNLWRFLRRLDRK
jgi:positive regulator of sigma E activity